MSAPLEDAAERQRIRDDTATTLFVNAGAGSGKTAALIGRVITLVLRDGVRLRNIAAVTFTEKAGAELRDRLRAAFEETWQSDPRAAEALDDLDNAAIGTLHSFAQRLLTEHPIEAGLPPIIEVLDEVGSSVAFEGRWAELRTALLDDDEIAQPLLLAMSLGMNLKHLRSLALLLGKDWDLIEDRILIAPPPPLAIPDVADLVARVRAFAERAECCRATDDKLLPKLAELVAHAGAVDAAVDTGTKFAALAQIAKVKFSNGQAKNWTVPVAQVRDEGKQLAGEADALVRGVLDQALRQLTHWVARRVMDAADARRLDGKLEFHDLLVLARNLLRRDAGVRAAAHEDYQRLLLDEFQDTDPIQIELAARICGGAGADAPDWESIDIPDGRLFVVGDSKQSIYRFRRASIKTYLDAERHIGEPAGLTTNFRSVAPILDWINAVFGRLIQPVADGQPGYVPLGSVRSEASDGGPAVTVLGADPHDDLPRAAAAILREREAADVAATIRQALEQRWQIFDERAGVGWRDATLDDIAVLVPARTSLSFLEDALDAAQIPYRAEASSLVYQADEVRSLLACARAIADPTDRLSLVTALRSPLFGCGDDDLWRWRHGGGSFSIFSTLDGSGSRADSANRSGSDARSASDADPLADQPDSLAAAPVGAALTYLRKLSFAARWMTPSEVLACIIADRRMLEVSATRPRARDAWRRLRFVVDQARAWSEASHGGLRAYLAWAAMQGQEVARVAEAVLPEMDVNAVRVMTIHAAKGLEFPIVILSGMTAQGRVGQGVTLLWPTSGGYQVKLSGKVETGDYEAAVPIDEQMDSLEKLRLLYVAASRARDHLVVSLHRGTRTTQTAAKTIADVDGASAAGATAFAGYALDESTVEPPVEPLPPPPFADWLDGVESARRASRVIAAISASGLEGTEPEIVFAADDEQAGLAKGARDLDLPPWSKGRYGSAIGRAVHAVLQVVDLASGAGVAEAVAAQALAEGVVGHEALVRSLVDAALASDVVQRAATREHWRETYVGTVRDDGTLLEGYIDLVYREDDGTLAIVDYKTDAVPSEAFESRVTYYAPQMAAYREALSAATAANVTATLLFLRPETSVAMPVRS